MTTLRPPFTLDTATAKVVYDMFRTLNRELNLTTLIVSHDPGIAHHVDRVISIRDGKLAGETVRNQPQPNLADADAPEQEETFEELIVLDNTGRLQIPQAMRDELGFERRVRLEQTADGVLIKPVKSDK